VTQAVEGEIRDPGLLQRGLEDTGSEGAPVQVRVQLPDLAVRSSRPVLAVLAAPRPVGSDCVTAVLTAAPAGAVGGGRAVPVIAVADLECPEQGRVGLADGVPPVRDGHPLAGEQQVIRA
jgi:hypothetical protein